MIDNVFVKKNAVRIMELPLDEFMKLHPPPYIIEPKKDGEYVMVEYDNGKVTLANKHNTIYSESMLPTDILNELHDTFKGYNYVLAVAEFCSDKGELYDFLSQRVKLEGKLELWIYDFLRVNNEDLMGMKYETRKIYGHNEGMTESEHILFMPFTFADTKEEILNFFEEMVECIGEEGIVIKPAYEDYYHAHWNKMKKYTTDDFVIRGITKTESYLKSNPPHSFLLSKADGSTWDKVGSGLSNEERDMINRFIPALKEAEDKVYIYLKPFFVVECKFTRRLEHSLREPRITKLRSDKAPEDCI